MNLEQYPLFRFACAVERDEELFKGERKRLMKGVFSTERQDKHGEVMHIHGMDFAPYLAKGRINYDHLAGAQHVLGRPLEARIVSDISKYNSDMSGPGGYHIAEIYDTEAGRAAWDLVKAEYGDPGRRWGWSVQGAILKSRGRDLLETRVDDMALTPQPANTDTYVQWLEKSFMVDNAPALVLQQIDDNQGVGAESHNSPAIKGFDNLETILWGPCKHDCYDRNGRFRTGAKSAYFHLVKCRGVAEQDAYSLVTSLQKAGYLK